MNFQNLISCDQKQSFTRYSLPLEVSQKLSWRVLGGSLHARTARQSIRILIVKKIACSVTKRSFGRYSLPLEVTQKFSRRVLGAACKRERRVHPSDKGKKEKGGEGKSISLYILPPPDRPHLRQLLVLYLYLYDIKFLTYTSIYNYVSINININSNIDNNININIT